MIIRLGLTKVSHPWSLLMVPVASLSLESWSWGSISRLAEIWVLPAFVGLPVTSQPSLCPPLTDLKRAVIPDAPHSCQLWCLWARSPSCLLSHHPAFPASLLVLLFTTSSLSIASPLSGLLPDISTATTTSNCTVHTRGALSQLWGFIRNVDPAATPGMLTHSCGDCALTRAG